MTSITEAFNQNTAEITSSVLGFVPKPSDPYAIYVLQKSKRDYACFILDVACKDVNLEVLFICAKDISAYIQDPMHAVLRKLYEPVFDDKAASLLHLASVREVVLKNLYYNIAGIYVFSFLDSLGMLGGSKFIKNDVPALIEKSECIEHLKRSGDSVTMVTSKKNKDEYVMCIGLLQNEHAKTQAISSAG